MNAKKKKSLIIKYSLAIIILIFLCGILYTFPQYKLRKQAKEKTKAEIKLIASAVEMYIAIHGTTHTSDYSGDLDFAEYLSTILPNPEGDAKPHRPMLIDFAKEEIYLSNENYNHANATKIKILDPYEQPYIYLFDSKKKTFMILSLGLDGEADLPDLSTSYDSQSEFNKDNITSVD